MVSSPPPDHMPRPATADQSGETLVLGDQHLPRADRPLRLGTRASPLAMAQAQMTAAALIAAHELEDGAIQILPMTATGDRIQDRALADVGGKALWTRELDGALDGGMIDIAVHSLKDVETERDAAFVLGAMLPRADVRDRLIVRDDWAAASIAALPPGTRFGTSSPRRAAQLRALRPDIAIMLLRGNVATRLARVAERAVDATLLAAAGLDRLGMVDTGHAVPVDQCLPAASQGAIGIECRSDDGVTLSLLAAIDHAPTRAAVTAERAFLLGVAGDCRSPVAAHAAWRGEQLWLDAQLFSPDGSAMVCDGCAITGPDDAAALGRAMLARAPDVIRRLFGG